jgi:hypothetical protein
MRRWRSSALLPIGLELAFLVGAAACSGSPPGAPEEPPAAGGVLHGVEGAAASERAARAEAPPETTGKGRRQPDTLGSLLPVPGQDGRWTQVVAGGTFLCALSLEGEPRCWTLRDAPPMVAPAGPFSSISAGVAHACGLREDGSAECWGDAFGAATTAPAGGFEQISAGFGYSCAVRQGGELACWGHDTHGQTQPPEGRFRSVAAGYTHSCAVRMDGAAICWGDDRERQTRAPEGRFEMVDVGECTSCGIREGGTVACWGCEQEHTHFRTRPGVIPPAAGPPTNDGWVRLAMGYQHVCALDDRGGLQCWGHSAVDEALAPEGLFRSIDAGFYSNCALRADGAPVCWGWDALVADETPEDYDPATAEDRTHSVGARSDRQYHTCPYEGLGALYLMQGRSREARAQLERAVILAPDIEYQKYLILAEILVEDGERERAIQLLRKAREICPEDPRAEARLRELQGSRAPGPGG